jgi:exodeoxyribonuclease V alpha subunit
MLNNEKREYSLMVEQAKSSTTDAGNALAIGFADFMQRLAVKLGAFSDAAQVAGEAGRHCILALSEGDVCIELSMLARSLGRPEEDIRKVLMDAKVVTSGGDDEVLPIVVDRGGRIYLYRYYDHERQLARAIVSRIPNASLPSLNAAARRFLEERFAENAGRLSGRTDWQKVAVELALTNSLTIISGGPGTGKTTIVTTLIAALAMNNPLPRIALLASTGKAAARMKDSMNKQMSTLSPELRQRLPDRASTIHMIMGAVPDSNDFRHNSDNPLPYDLIVIDEASMIDLSLAARLFSALLPETRVIMLGDKDQLAAVEAGAVFAEMAKNSFASGVVGNNSLKENPLSGLSRKSAKPEQKNLSDCVVWLTENYRFRVDSPIAELASLVVNSEDEKLVQWLYDQKSDEVKWEDIGEDLPVNVVEQLVLGFDEYVEAVIQSGPEKVLNAYENFCVLCAVRHGKRGVAGINDILTRKLRSKLSGQESAHSPWYHGRPVMVTENDYSLGVFNGDIGIALKGNDGIMNVWFAARSGDVRPITPSSLPAHQTAFAMTVHKSQGSEFDQVAFVLPAKDSPVLTRELVYTAVSRAKQKLSVYGNMEILRMAVKRHTLRRSGLAEKIELLAQCKHG